MESVATPHPLQIPSSPAIIGVPAGSAILLIASVFCAMVLSVGILQLHLSLARKKEMTLGMVFYGFKNHPDLIPSSSRYFSNSVA